jgi:hypothetical protein
MRSCFVALICLFPTHATAERLLCLGTFPGFMMQIEGAEVMLDYLGDGTYTLEPELPDTITEFTRHELVTRRERWPVFVEARACPTQWKTLPIMIEIAIPTSSG